MRDGRAADVAAKALEPSAVARWDSDLGVYVDAATLAHALVLAGACRVHDAQQWLARSFASEAVPCCCGRAERRKRELLTGRLLCAPRPALACVLMTGLYHETTEQQARALYVFEIVAKPFALSSLIAVVERAAETTRAHGSG